MQLEEAPSEVEDSPMLRRSSVLQEPLSASISTRFGLCFFFSSGAIPLLSGTGALTCSVSDLGRVHPSLDDLVVPGSPRSTISIPNLVRTPDRHSPLQLRAPELKRSASLSLPVAWITGAPPHPGEDRLCS
ncbi:hypothetical protein WMY93_018460 [Mugilogobius chulae]|uniref:Uncharacterized protein n=1 Tax=Mugilogobius chulae TaxID=88201 RepID=A0AAW0NQT3_9GOBI